MVYKWYDFAAKKNQRAQTKSFEQIFPQKITFVYLCALLYFEMTY